jgi:hypothetical protein
MAFLGRRRASRLQRHYLLAKVAKVFPELSASASAAAVDAT